MRQTRHRRTKTYEKNRVWWNIYILDVDNKGKKIKGTPHTRLYYTGISKDVGHRLGDYLYGRGHGFINDQCKDAIKKLVHVEHFFGTEWDAIQRERQIKKMSRERKEKLINSDGNMLVRYVPLKAVVLRKSNNPEEQIARMVR